MERHGRGRDATHLNLNSPAVRPVKSLKGGLCHSPGRTKRDGSKFWNHILPKIIQYALYTITVLVGLLAMYSILNAGNPESVIRIIFPNPASDIYVAGISSFVVFVLGFVVFYTKDREGFQHLIELNDQRIRSLRDKGKTDAEIADSILAAMGSTSGYRHRMARKKLTIYLAEFR
jgi:hypothetical protein